MIQYKDHARTRMKERKISEEEVEYCLKNYDISYTDNKGNPIYVSYTPSGRRIKVVVETNSNPIVVITVGD